MTQVDNNIKKLEDNIKKLVNKCATKVVTQLSAPDGLITKQTAQINALTEKITKMYKDDGIFAKNSLQMATMARSIATLTASVQTLINGKIPELSVQTNVTLTTLLTDNTNSKSPPNKKICIAAEPSNDGTNQQ